VWPKIGRFVNLESFAQPRTYIRVHETKVELATNEYEKEVI
jgi:hypothetical protein